MKRHIDRFEGRVAVITGAGSGIGRATAIELARRGCSVAVVDINPTAAAETVALLRGPDTSSNDVNDDRNHTAHTVDVRMRQHLDRLRAEVLDAHGACHILVNNAGVTSAGRFADESDEDLEWIIGTNLWGVLHTTRAFLPLLHAADAAHIVNLSSMVGLVGLPHNTSYALTKGAVRSFSESLRAELITSNIGVTAVFPGSIRTNITEAARGTHGHTIQRLGRHRLASRAMRHPDVVARRIVRGIERNRARVVIGPDARAMDLLARVAPGRSGFIGRLTSRLVGKD